MVAIYIVWNMILRVISIILFKSDIGSKVTIIGMGVNILLTFGKGFGGMYSQICYFNRTTNSISLMADATHSLSGKL